MEHYIAMSGNHGCLPDHCEVFESADDAVNDLVQLFELGRSRKARLARTWYLPLIPTLVEIRQDVDFGAEYCEIQSCACKTPTIHSDYPVRDIRAPEGELL